MNKQGPKNAQVFSSVGPPNGAAAPVVNSTGAVLSVVKSTGAQMQTAKSIVSVIKRHYYSMGRLEGIALHKHNHVLPIMSELLNIPDCYYTMQRINFYQTGLVYNYLTHHPYKEGFEPGFLKNEVNFYPI